ncbi:serine hydrolase [Mycolicibacterium goodii]|uniref:serine hydrolase n=1 Tax=Mycolicibacterium goodii TaxID=134601 RepID=UPI001F041732|nr:serine hydrolase [Mycolicibacterium goodii]ULN44886.1 serine hydrolase [Mycolicibacterium goodii]
MTDSTRAFNNPKQIGTLTAFNREDLQSLEIPAVNGIGTARSVAKAYGAAASRGAALDLKPSVIEELVGPATPPTRGRRDEVLRVEANFSLGFSKPFPSFTFGSSDQAFGIPGAGASFGFADPDTGVGFAYAMNKCGFHLWNDPRELVLRHALFHDVLKTRPQA